jgi:hypothetical protein
MKEILDHRTSPVNEEIRVEQEWELEPSTKPVNYVPAPKCYSVYARSHGEWQKTVQLRFHAGDLTPAGPNGLTNEVLLAVVLDRLRQFQAGPMACRENSKAAEKVEEALHWLAARTRERASRGVEGRVVP